MFKHYSAGLPFRWTRLLFSLVLLLPLASWGQNAQIVISQVYGGGGNTGAQYSNDFIELHNVSTNTVSLAGYSVQYASATGSSWQVTNLSGTLAPGKYYLIQEAAGTGTPGALPSPDATGAIPMSGTAGKVALVSSTTALSGLCPTTNIIDLVGFGTTANCFEGTGPTPAPSNSTAVLRNNNGCTDTNNNAGDFTAGTPTPRNSASPAQLCSTAATCLAPSAPTFSGTTSTSTVVSFTPSTTNTDPYTVTAVPASGATVTATGSTTSIALTGLSPSTSYSVTVTGTCTAAAGGGTSPASPAATATTPAPPCNAPTGVTASSVGTTTASISFSGNSTATGGYTVNYTEAGGTTLTQAGTSSPISLSGLTPGTSYTVTVTSNCGGSSTATSAPAINFTTQAAAPTLSSINPTSIPAGLTTTVTFTGTNFTSGAVVNFNGSTVPTNVTNSTTLTADIAAPAANTTATFPVTVTTSGGTSGSQTLTVTGTPSGFYEPFEVGSKGAYATGSVTLATGSYTFDDALIGTSTADLKNGTKSARIRQGSVTMNFDKANGAGTITLVAGNYGIDTNGRLVVSVSNGGSTAFTAYVSPTTTLGSSLQTYTFTANVAGPVRVRISNTGTAERISVDDLQISDYTVQVACSAPSTPTFTNITQTTADVTVTPGANGSGPYTVTATPTAGGTAITASGASPVSLTGLAPGTSYSVTVTSNCNAGFTSPSQPSAAATLITATPAPTLAVSQGGTSYPSGGTAYSFGSQTLNTTSSAVAFTLTNSSPDLLTISNVATTGDFAVSGTAPTTVVGGQTATVNVTFRPTSLGTRTGTLVISSNATNGATYTVNLTGNGAAATLPDLTVSTGSTASPALIAGAYNNVTITGTGVALLASPLVVSGTLTIQPGGVLAQGCQALTGTGNFNLQAGGTFIICDPLGISPTGTPTGAVLLTGTRTYSPGANYIYNGALPQVTGAGLPGTVLALGLQNPRGLTLSQGLSLVQGLQLQAGDLNTNGQPLVLLSSATGTALVVNAGGVVNGTATVQRYINSANAIGYRHYSAPVSNTTLGDLSAPGFTPVFNPSYNASATPGTVTPFPTVFGYDQSRVTTVASNYTPFDKGWFSPGGPTDPMTVGKGYSVNAPNTALVDFVGTLNNGPQPSGTLNRGNEPASGWHLLGNPYPSPLDWSTVAPSQRPGLDAAIYVFESSGRYGGSYRASVNGVGGNANSPNALVASAQGYFVRVSAPNGTGSVTLDNSNRVTTFGPQPAFGRGTADTRPQLALELQGASATDAAYVYFQAGATAAKDVEFDATKLPNSHGLNLASVAGGEELAINGLPALGTAPVLVPLIITAPQAGSYTLTASSVANLAGTTVTLLDALTNTRTVLTDGVAYAFSLSSTTATGRFSLEFRASNALATTPAQALAAQTLLFPNPASASFRVQLPVRSSASVVSATLANALGQTVLTRTLRAPAGQAVDAEFDVRTLAAGMYTLCLNVDGIPVVRKVVVE